MAKITKYLFAGLGWAIGGPIGALLGYLLGTSLSSNAKQPSANTAPKHSGRYRDTGTQQDINVALMVLIAAVMKADGVVKRSELDHVKRFLLANYGETRGKEMLGHLRQLVSHDIPIDQVCQQIKVNTSYTTRYHMVDFLFSIAAADSDLHIAELSLLNRIAHQLGISQADLISMQTRYAEAVGDNTYSSGNRGQRRSRPTDDTYTKDPYRVLGIDSSATDDEVKRAYRRMAMKYHPDRVADMSEEIQQNAARQMREINEAYEVIKLRRSSLK